MNTLMIDIQTQNTHYPLPISLAGISDLSYPIVFSNNNESQSTLGKFDIAVSLPSTERGTHMSRFLELLEDCSLNKQIPISIESLKCMHQSLLIRSQVERGKIAVAFDYFLEKTAPASGKKSLLPYQVTLSATGMQEELSLGLQLDVFVTTLCPCSKEISQYGAHNQRSLVTLKGKISDKLYLNELIKLVEGQASCEIFALLKRVDEKYVTEHAYENPKFVEDMVRDIGRELHQHPQFLQEWSVESKHFESIHHHNAYAFLSYNS